MVYKKYIQRNGKTYGPYVYHSRRINGKVVSEYRGPEENQNKKKLWPILIISFLVIALASILFFSNSKSSGNVVLDIVGSLNDGDLSNGKLNFVLSEGELIPIDSIVSIENNGTIWEYRLKDLVENEKTSSGMFNLKSGQLLGNGEGFGIEGTKIEYPVLTFQLTDASEETTIESNSTKVNSEKNDDENSSLDTEENILNETLSNNEENQTSEEQNNSKKSQKDILVENETNGESSPNTQTEEETILNQQEETILNQQEENKEVQVSENSNSEISNENIEPSDKSSKDTSPAETTSNDQPLETPSIESAPITGNVISGILGTVSKFFTGIITGRVIEDQSIINGEVSKENSFVYKLQGKKLKLVSGSVTYSGETLPDNTISIEEKGGEITIRTNYSILTKGFGLEYSGDKTKTLSIDMTQLSKILTEGNLKVKISYNNSEIVSFDEKISNETIKNPEKEIVEEIFNESITVPTNILETINFDMNLTQKEKNLLIFRLNETNFTTVVNKYKERFLVEFSFAGYNIEHSYSGSFSEEELDKNIERDKYLWIQDIIKSLSNRESQKEELTNLTKTNSLF